jgi:hypothetical protein
MTVQRSAARLARRLAAPGAYLEVRADGYVLVRSAASGGTQVDPRDVKQLRADGAIEAGRTGRLVVSAAGRTMLRRLLAGGDDFAGQHQARTTTMADLDGECVAVTVDLAESPLAWLRAHKGRDGRPLISEEAYLAGERLRADFTRGQMMPRVTANWSSTVSSSRRDGAGGMAELTEAALSARMRCERALAAVGPELSGVLVDFCCFLKGIEDIETAQGWPKRSAKLVLQLALSALARHYGLSAQAKGRANAGGLRHWGADDYRPVTA